MRFGQAFSKVSYSQVIHRLKNNFFLAFVSVPRILNPAMKLFTVNRCPTCRGKGKIRTASPKALRQIRKKIGLSLEAVGKKIGFSKMYMSDIETGRRRATAKIVKAYQKL